MRTTNKKGLFRLFSTKKINQNYLPDDLFGIAYKKCMKVAMNDLKDLKWALNIIRSEDSDPELEFLHKTANSTVVLKAYISRFDRDYQKEIEIKNGILSTAEMIKDAKSDGQKESLERFLEEEVETLQDDEMWIPNSRFVVGIYVNGKSEIFVAECVSKKGDLNLENVFLITDKELGPKYDGIPYLKKFENFAWYKGPKVLFLNPSISLCLNQFVALHGIESPFLHLLEYTSSLCFFNELNSVEKILKEEIRMANL